MIVAREAVESTTATPLTVTPIEAAADIAPDIWDGLAHRGLHLHGCFTVAEADSHFRPRHLVVSDAIGMRAIFPVYLEDSGLHGDLHERWLGPAGNAATSLGLKLRPTLVVSPPYGQGSEPLGAAATLPETTLEEVFERLEEQAQRDGARAVVWPFLTSAQERILRIGKRRGYARAFAGCAAVVQVEWPSFDEYLATRSRRVRKTLRRELRALREPGLEIELLTDFRSVAREMDALYRAFFMHRNGHAPRLDPRFFERIAQLRNPGIWAHITRRNGRLVATGLNFHAGSALEGTFGAYAAEVKGKPIYHNCMFYERIRDACTRGIPRIELGSGSLYPKVLRGAKLQPRTTLVRGTTPATRALLSTLARLVTARNLGKDRRAVALLGITVEAA